MLWLADWRRRLAALYAEVRRLAETDPGAALVQWRDARERLYRSHPASPVPAGARERFRAQHFPHDPALRFETTVVPAEVDDGRAAAPGALRRVAWLEVRFPAGVRRLALFWLEEYASGLFLPFGDATNGAETYAGGRYLLDGAKSADLGGDPARGTLILDFNFAYQPSCAFDPCWACPLAPPENRLDIRVEAGERLLS